MVVANYKYVIYRGDTDSRFIEFFTDEDKLIPYDLSIFTSMKMEVKKVAGSRAVITLDNTLGLTIDVNKLTFDMPNLITDVDAGAYVYDVEGIEAGGEVTTILRGEFIVQQDITI